jgi:hypothetical protein
MAHFPRHARRFTDADDAIQGAFARRADAPPVEKVTR